MDLRLMKSELPLDPATKGGGTLLRARRGGALFGRKAGGPPPLKQHHGFLIWELGIFLRNKEIP